MTITEVIACFKGNQDVFVAITGKPSDEDILQIREVLTPILMCISYDKEHRIRIYGD